MNIVTEAEGYVMMIAAIQCRATDPARSSSFLHMAVKKFEDVLNSNTHNKVSVNTALLPLLPSCLITGNRWHFGLLRMR